MDVESMVRDYLHPATAQIPVGDCPPKYEEVQAVTRQMQPPLEEEEAPPQYDESMAAAMAASLATATTDATVKGRNIDTNM